MFKNDFSVNDVTCHLTRIANYLRKLKINQTSKKTLSINLKGAPLLTLSSQYQVNSTILDSGYDDSTILEVTPTNIPGANETSLSKKSNKTFLDLNNARSADNLAYFNKDLGSRFQLPIDKEFFAPLFGKKINFEKDVQENFEVTKNAKSEFLNAKLILKSIDSKEKLKLKQQTTSVISVAKKVDHPNNHSPSKIVSPEKNIKPNSFSLKSTYFTNPIARKQGFVNFSIGESSPRKITIKRDTSIRKAENKDLVKKGTVFPNCFNKKYSEADFKSRDKSREFKISFSRIASQSNIRQQRDLGLADSNQKDSSDSTPKEASTPSKVVLNGSFSQLDALQKHQSDIVSRGLDRISFTKLPSSENKQIERLTAFSPFAIQKAWTDKDEFVLEHQRAVKRNQANRRMRILQSSINLLEKEQISNKVSDSLSPVKKMTKKNS